MSPAGAAVPIEVARLAIDVADLRGELNLLAATVGQQVQTVSVQLNEVHAEQLRAREDRMAQTATLTQLLERTSLIPDSSGRMQALELKVSHWRGVVVGFGIAMSLLVGAVVYVYQTDRTLVNNRIDANTAAIRQLERVK